MTARHVATIATTLLVLLTAQQAFAHDRFMALTGKDSGDCAGERRPCRTLQYAMRQMEGGDTLLIEDGEYTGSADTIDQHHGPPSGTRDKMTVIRARNIPGRDGVPADQPLRVRFTGKARFEVTNKRPTSYVEFRGIRWNGISTYTGWDNIVFKQVASQGIHDGNTGAITIGGKRNLLEDVVAFGKGRYKIVFYDFSRKGEVGDNLCRRCIVRQDWAKRNDPTKDPIAGFSSYYNRGTGFLNSIVIDSDQPDNWMENPGELAGAFYQPVDAGPHAMIIKGSLVVNTAMAAVYTRSGSSGHKVSDFAAAKVAGGIGAHGEMDIDRVTLVDVGTEHFSYRSGTQKSQVLAADVGIAGRSGVPVSVKNAVIMRVKGPAVKGGSITGDNVVTSADNLRKSLRMPMQGDDEERGRGRSGARIVHRLGKDGTFKGETGWDQEQREKLWPWPLEKWVRAEMRSMDRIIGGDRMPDPARGFCADEVTLSGYIKGYFGTLGGDGEDIRRKK